MLDVILKDQYGKGLKIDNENGKNKLAVAIQAGEEHLKVNDSGELYTDITQTVDVKLDLENVTFNDGQLHVQLSDGTYKDVPFTPSVVVKALESATDEQKKAIASALSNAILESIKGEALADLDSDVKGYLLKK